MTLIGNDLARRYADALREYLTARGEESLAEAYSLGREAIKEGVGILDIASIHHDAIFHIADELRGSGTSQQFNEFASGASSFYKETLAPFEMTHRGFKEATEFVRDEVRFSAVLTHELMTPITSVFAAAGMLRDLLAHDPTSPESELVANVIDGINTLNARAIELIGLVRLQSGALGFNMEQMDIGAVVRKTCQQLKPAVIQSGMTLRTRIGRCLPKIEGDASRLEQVVSNLIQNGIRHAQDGGRLDVSVQPWENMVAIRVRDYGHGVAEHIRRSFLQSNFQLLPSERLGVSGMGIGLRLCHFIIQAHGGSITIEPARGGGSVFEVRLPAGAVA